MMVHVWGQKVQQAKENRKEKKPPKKEPNQIGYRGRRKTYKSKGRKIQGKSEDKKIQSFKTNDQIS
jgi:hypothetical protein